LDAKREEATDRIEALAALLTESEAAHGVYETAELNGVYDQAWPSWYAAYAIDHGIGALVGHPIAADKLAEFLASTFADFKEIEPNPSEGWAAYAARRIMAEL
jgi:hypothetical protein